MSAAKLGSSGTQLSIPLNGIDVIKLSKQEAARVVSLQEGHFLDVKAIEIAPAKLTKTLSALSNAEGGEVYIGIAENKAAGGLRSWRGFESVEKANGHIQAFEGLFPLGDGYTYTFLQCEGESGFVLKIDVAKNRSIKVASDGVPYLRRGAQNLPVTTDDDVARLKRNKGLTSFETETVAADSATVTNSAIIISFMLQVVPTGEPAEWLAKQQLLLQNKPTVAAVVLFAEEPQAILPKRCGIKIYRYKTTAAEGSRETLAGDPLSIEGDAYQQIFRAVAKTAEIIESVRVSTPDGLEEVKYPTAALHEIITNAVLHRDYSVTDDIHIRIFDNRVEVDSPGTLPGHVTPENILKERFARNPAMVRLINKFPNPPNKDVGECLNTAFHAMRDLKLKPPIVSLEGGYVRILLRHEPLATPEELVMEYLQNNVQIANSIARQICFIGSENKMKLILQRMVKNGYIELVPGTTRHTAAYRLVRK